MSIKKPTMCFNDSTGITALMGLPIQRAKSREREDSDAKKLYKIKAAQIMSMECMKDSQCNKKSLKEIENKEKTKEREYYAQEIAKIAEVEKERMGIEKAKREAYKAELVKQISSDIQKHKEIEMEFKAPASSLIPTDGDSFKAKMMNHPNSPIKSLPKKEKLSPLKPLCMMDDKEKVAVQHKIAEDNKRILQSKINEDIKSRQEEALYSQKLSEVLTSEEERINELKKSEIMLIKKQMEKDQQQIVERKKSQQQNRLKQSILVKEDITKEKQIIMTEKQKERQAKIQSMRKYYEELSKQVSNPKLQ